MFRITEKLYKPVGYGEDDPAMWVAVHAVQMKVLFFWVTIKEFPYDQECFAKELLNLLEE